MKQRIIATILLLVTVLTTFAGCANYAFAEKESFADYASVNYDELMKALHTIEIEEEDFGPTEDRQAIVVDEIYNTILTALNKDAEKKQTSGKLSSLRDMVEYYYYCEYEGYTFDYHMTSTTNTLTTSEDEKDLKKAIVNALLDYTFDEEKAYEIKKTLTNEKIISTDEIVVSYTLKTEKDGVTKYTDHNYVTISQGNELFDAIITNNEYAVVLGSYKPGESVTVGENVYKNISISHIVKNEGTFVKVEHTTEDEQDVTAYTADGVKTNITIPEGATVKYVVYPVAYVNSPEVTADLVIRYVLGDDISTSDLTILNSEEYTVTVGEETLSVKALVEKLSAEYKKTADDYDYEGSAVELAKQALADERKAAQAQSIKDKLTSLAKATKTVDGAKKSVTDVILAEYNEGKDDADKAANIYDVFYNLSGKNTGKIKFSDLIDGGILTLYTYKDTNGNSAVTLINEINAEYEKNLETDYESYTSDHNKTIAGNEIDVPYMKEKYEYTVAQAQNTEVNKIIENLLACKKGEASVESEIVKQYGESVYNTEFTSYDLLMNVLLTTSSTSSTFDSFIEDLSDYVYGNSEVDDEDRETFATVLEDLVAEFGKTASGNYEHVEEVKKANLEVEKAESALNTAKETETSLTDITITKIADELLKFKKTSDDKDAPMYALYALFKVYESRHPETVYAISPSTKDTNAKSVYTYASSVLQLILDDIAEDDKALDEYKKVIADGSFEYKASGVTDTTPIRETAILELEKAVEIDTASKNLAKAKEAYTKAQETAHKDAVNALAAKLLSATHTEDGETQKLSVVLANRYVDNKLNSKISTYNTNVKNKLAKAIYDIINDDAIVTIDKEHPDYPTKLIKEFVETIKAGYEYTYYTGTSTETTPGTPAVGVTPEQRAEYEKQIAIYNEAQAAVTSAETGISNATTAYINAVMTIYELEGLMEGETSYFDDSKNGFDGLVKAYYDADAAYDAAVNANSAAKAALTKAEKALVEAEKYLESAKAEKVDFFDFEALAAKRKAIKDARQDVKAAEEAVEAADKAINGTKKDPSGTKKTLEDATEALEKAKEALIEKFNKEGNKEQFADTQKQFETGSVTNKTKKYLYNLAANYLKYKNNYDDAKAIVEAAGDDVTTAQKKALKNAEDAYKGHVEDHGSDLTVYYGYAKDYLNAALVYYADANAVLKIAEKAFEGAAKILDDEKDEDGNVTKEGLKTIIANSETDTAGEALKNVDAYATFEDYLEFVLGADYETVLEDEARKMLDEQIRIYAVAKKLSETVVVDGLKDYEIKDEETGEVVKTITVEAYKTAIESRYESTFKGLLTHSLTHDDEDMKPGKLKRELKKSWKELLESTEEVFVSNKVYRGYKNDLGRSNYIYAKEQYGDNNLRMYLQFENLLTYLLFTDYQDNPYAAHDGEYTVKENEDGTLEYLFITYEFPPEENVDAE